MRRDSTNDMQEGEPPPRFDLKELLWYGTRRSLRWILAIVVAAGLIGFIAGMQQPNVYTSEAKLLLRLGSREQITPEVLVESEPEGREARTTMQDEIHMLGDSAIYERVAKVLGPAEVLQPADPKRNDAYGTPWHLRAFHTLQSWFLGGGGHGCGPGGCTECIRDAAFVLRLSTTLLTERDSNVITVRHTSTSPEKARAFTRAIVAAFIERHADQFSVEPYLEENKDKLAEAQGRRDAASKAYFDHIGGCGLIDLETQRPALLNDIDLLERELFAATVRRDEIQAERNALLERLKGSSSQIDIVRERAPNPAYLDLKERIQDLGVAALANDVRTQRLEEHVQDERKQLDQLRDCEKLHATLSALRTGENLRYENLYRRFSQLEDLGRIDLRNGANLAVLQPATLNLIKDGPRRAKILIAALVAGVLFGVWIAVMREILDRKLRYPRAIERSLGIRVLGVIPEIQPKQAA